MTGITEKLIVRYRPLSTGIDGLSNHFRKVAFSTDLIFQPIFA